MCLVHGKVENRIHSVETSFAELGGPEGGVGRGEALCFKLAL